MTDLDPRFDSAIDIAVPSLVKIDSLDNENFPWDSFDSDAYFEHNYSKLRGDDEQIIDIVATFFQRNEAPRKLRPRAIDVGAGANLYPALTMLPFAAELHLVERAFTNREWLATEILSPHPSWWQFWDRMKDGRRSYESIRNPFDLLSRRNNVVKGNIFSLPAATYDMGTMFFVAESITTRDSEFVRATRSFVNSLVPRAPFAAAFMRDSSGYRVGARDFPACSVDERDVRLALHAVATDVRIQTVDSWDLRDGYHGMIVATGRKKPA
ncbi:methyltransferase [Actinoplanes sp. ATCC 53533]|uniref:SCO2525 family SAM-dependent methyltransferase n=1 Tax=Actinoplanes sp. ATCC 53533 TaxID=1288362 RepID=UPI000F772F2D|nr:SCO2525 family SAM-dependent methyltransferase [Actinoplanes sp. ATCC 53533]RSM73075.1 methyltransferase [Actinoplanes sp. ATCC 53533]